MAKKKTEQAVAAPLTETVSNIDYIKLPITDIRASHTNRKRFPEETLRELSESIKKAGVMQPILVRPVTPTEAEPESFELVAGERRWRASKLAGLTDIPASVRSLNDQEAAELQILENLHREDPHELEEALGYQNLMMQHGYAADDLAAKLGKSRTYIYARLKLCALASELHDDFYSNKLSASVALLLARLPSPELQKKAKSLITKDNEYLSYRSAQEIIRNQLLIDLGKATFPLNLAIEETKNRSFKSCVKCPKRAGNQPEVFADIDANTCTDSACFYEKSATYKDLQIVKAKKTGLSTYDLDETVTPTGMVRENCPLDYSFYGTKGDNYGKPLIDIIPASQLPQPAAIFVCKGTKGFLYNKDDIQSTVEELGLVKIENEEEKQQKKLDDWQRDKDLKAHIEHQAKLSEEAEAETNLRVKAYLAIRQSLTKDINVRREAVKAIVEAMRGTISGELNHVSHLYKFGVERGSAIDNHIQQCDDTGLLQVLLDISFTELIKVTRGNIDDIDTDDDSFTLLYTTAKEAGLDIKALREQVAIESEETAPTPDQAKSEPVSNWPFPTPAENTQPVEAPVERFRNPLLTLPKKRKCNLTNPLSDDDQRMDEMLIESEATE